jgi:hypothetical protein
VGWRHLELAAFTPEVVPLDPPDAAAAYDRTVSLCSRTRYGLDETAFDAIERLDVKELGPAARGWLAERVGGGRLLLVFGKDEVFRAPATVFLSHWQDMFCPSRDDVVIVPVGGGWALFYCHEEKFQFTRL